LPSLLTEVSIERRQPPAAGWYLVGTKPAAALEREVALVYRECAASLCRYAGAFGAEDGAGQDAVQEAFLRYFVARAAGREIEDPKAWLRRVLRNRLIDDARSAAARPEVALDRVPEAHDRHSDPESAFRNAQIVHRAGETLAPREMQCVRLRIEGLRYRQIGELLEIRTGTVGALLARAYRKMREAGR
jgi:RNA polymerase sigma-70 factor, ECF subfamily